MIFASAQYTESRRNLYSTLFMYWLMLDHTPIHSTVDLTKHVIFV